MNQLALEFDGRTYQPEHDRERLNSQLRRVFDTMEDGLWRTLAEISEATGDPQASVSARIRDLRKVKFGGFSVDKRRRGEPMVGLWEYRLVTEIRG